MFNAKDVKHIKDIVDWLNKEHPANGKFAAYFEKGDNITCWHIGCPDMFLYMSDDFKGSSQAIREIYPNLKLIFIYLYSVHIYVLNKRKELVTGQSVILIK